MINNNGLSQVDFEKVKFWYEQLDEWPLYIIERSVEEYYDSVSTGRVTVGEKRFVEKCLAHFVTEPLKKFENESNKIDAEEVVNMYVYMLKSSMVIVSSRKVYEFSKCITKENIAEYLVHPQYNIREFTKIYYKDLFDDSKD